jgi:hypothetical protein
LRASVRISRWSSPDSPVPDRRDQVVLADDPLAVADQKRQQIEYLGSDRNQDRPATQLAPARVQDEILEKITHRAVSAVPIASRRRR